MNLFLAEDIAKVVERVLSDFKVFWNAYFNVFIEL